VRLILKVYVNSEDKGEYFLFLTPEGDVMFSYGDIRALGFKSLPQRKEEYISLRALSPGVKFKIDQNESALYITVDPNLLSKHKVEYSLRQPKELSNISRNSAFLNYGIQYNMDDNFEYSSLSIPWDLGINAMGYFGFSNFFYRNTDSVNKITRLYSNITKDNNDKLQRYILGDFSAYSGDLGSGGTFGGISISKNYSIDPYFIRYPGLSLKGIINTPSDVELYVNGNLMKKEHLSPGEFEFSGMPYTTGIGDAVVVIKDAFGRETSINYPYYLSTRVLKKGLHEYAYNIGFRREELGEENFEYGNLNFLGYHRYGLSDSFTGGIRTEFGKDIFNIGTTASFILGRIGEFGVSAAGSRDQGQAGYSGILSYFYSGRNFSSRLFIRTLSEDYANLSLSASEDKARFSGLYGLGFNLRGLGSLSFNYTKSNFYSGTDVERFAVFYNKNIFRNVSFNITASRTQAEEVTHDIFAGLNFILGNKHSASLYYSKQGDKTYETVAFRKNPPLGTGFGYDFRAERRENNEGDKEIGGRAFVEYRGPIGIYSADCTRVYETNNYRLNLAGGATWLNGSLYLNRPVYDSFALVKVSDLEGVKVKYSNQEIGVTNKNGEIVVPDLTSYNENKISIDVEDLPVNYEVKEIDKNVTTSFRGGGLVRFDVKKLQAFSGKIFFSEDGKKTNAEYAGLDIVMGKEKIETIVGKGGEFYLENIPAGKFPARLFFKEKECNFYLNIPESKEIMVDLGEVTCEIEK
jgi:outer membrane usher protein